MDIVSLINHVYYKKEKNKEPHPQLIDDNGQVLIDANGRVYYPIVVRANRIITHVANIVNLSSQCA